MKLFTLYLKGKEKQLRCILMAISLLVSQTIALAGVNAHGNQWPALKGTAATNDKLIQESKEYSFGIDADGRSFVKRKGDGTIATFLDLQRNKVQLEVRTLDGSRGIVGIERLRKGETLFHMTDVSGESLTLRQYKVGFDQHTTFEVDSFSVTLTSNDLKKLSTPLWNESSGLFQLGERLRLKPSLFHFIERANALDPKIFHLALMAQASAGVAENFGYAEPGSCTTGVIKCIGNLLLHFIDVVGIVAGCAGALTGIGAAVCYTAIAAHPVTAALAAAECADAASDCQNQAN
ncbi:MAG: hypothetical protein SF097_17840 [Acidobacteriota bacterium]|nr:hypothetical protein [Acidobacteriota bacterium]